MDQTQKDAVNQWLDDALVRSWLQNAPRHQSKAILEIIAASEKALLTNPNTLASITERRHKGEEETKRMIPGVNEPVSSEEEVFKFTGTAEGAAKAAQPQGERKSKFDFAEGVYPGEAVAIIPYTSKSSSLPMFKLTMIGTGDTPARGITYDKYLPLTGKGVGITERILAVFGIKPVSKNEDGSPNYEFRPKDVVGKPGDMKLVSEEYDGKRKLKLDTIFTAKNVPAKTGAAANEVPF